MADLIVADTSCLIVLERMGQMEVLRALFGGIAVTQEVAAEFGEVLPAWIEIKNVKDAQKQRLLEISLDRGESSAIALCLENPGALLLIDERKGRQVAASLGISIIGTLGLFIKAQESGFIPSLAETLDKMQAAGFRIAPALLRQIKEKYRG